jgi:hypothetical protein
LTNKEKEELKAQQMAEKDPFMEAILTILEKVKQFLK